jgi:DNA-binding transcriptional regulator YiaG
MPNITAVLKAEICRLAKKEAKVATSKLKRASVQYRSDIAKLRKQIGQQAKLIAHLKKQKGQPQTAEEPTNGVRFSARSVKAQRKRLGLSAEKYAKLVGVSGLTIYSWESGKSKPRKAQFDALVAARGIGKREAMQRLEEMKAKRGKRKRTK